MIGEVETLSENTSPWRFFRDETKETENHRDGLQLAHVTQNGKDKERCAVIRVNADASSHIYRRVVERDTGESNNGYREGVKKLSALNNHSVWCCISSNCVSSTSNTMQNIRG